VQRGARLGRGKTGWFAHRFLARNHPMSGMSHNPVRTIGSRPICESTVFDLPFLRNNCRLPA